MTYFWDVCLVIAVAGGWLCGFVFVSRFGGFFAAAPDAKPDEGAFFSPITLADNLWGRALARSSVVGVKNDSDVGYAVPTSLSAVGSAVDVLINCTFDSLEYTASGCCGAKNHTHYFDPQHYAFAPNTGSTAGGAYDCARCG